MLAWPGLARPRTSRPCRHAGKLDCVKLLVLKGKCNLKIKDEKGVDARGCAKGSHLRQRALRAYPTSAPTARTKRTHALTHAPSPPCRAQLRGAPEAREDRRLPRQPEGGQVGQRGRGRGGGEAEDARVQGVAAGGRHARLHACAVAGGGGGASGTWVGTPSSCAPRLSACIPATPTPSPTPTLTLTPTPTPNPKLVTLTLTLTRWASPRRRRSRRRRTRARWPRPRRSRPSCSPRPSPRGPRRADCPAHLLTARLTA